MASSSRNHYTVFPIEGTINDRGLILSVEDHHFSASTTLVEGTTLSNFMVTEAVPKSDAITAGFGSYVYKSQLPKEGNRLRFLFLKAKTEDQQLETVKEPYTIYEELFWPDWLMGIYGVKTSEIVQKETGFDGANPVTKNVQVFRYYDRYRLIKGGSFNTEVQVSQYFSQSPLSSFIATEPRPMPVFYNVYGMSNRLDCLHRDLFFGEVAVEYAKLANFGSIDSIEEWSLGRKFPQTNMIGWEPHHRRVQVTPRDGGYFYDVHWVIPPAVNPEILV